MGFASAANAQVSASASLTSDYQYRGVSLSDGKPTLSLDIAYDHASGLYAGGSAIAEDTATAGVEMLGHVEYAGYSRRVNSADTWDVGITNQNISKYYDQRYVLNYAQVYTGLSTAHFSYYVYYSPNYFGTGYRTVYADVSAAFRPARRWRVFGHAGVLAAFGATGRPQSAYQQYDFRAGVAAQFKGGEVRIIWTTVRPGTDYLAGQLQSHPTLTLGATAFF
ncbi:MAG: TorF family putative porin [Pseudomonadota bacterium]|nr:TorF family putative porin [Pseudomonadota bacterium]